ncbi:unnamed protein product [Ectocarpus sp. 8 AP-2014]
MPHVRVVDVHSAVLGAFAVFRFTAGRYFHVAPFLLRPHMDKPSCWLGLEPQYCQSVITLHVVRKFFLVIRSTDTIVFPLPPIFHGSRYAAFPCLLFLLESLLVFLHHSSSFVAGCIVDDIQCP